MLRLLNGFGELWVPGATWDTGMPTPIGGGVLEYEPAREARAQAFRRVSAGAAP